jgi:hypothetical protein
MEIEKIQRYLKNRHKFDKKKDIPDTIEHFKKISNELYNSIKNAK